MRNWILGRSASPGPDNYHPVTHGRGRRRRLRSPVLACAALVGSGLFAAATSALATSTADAGTPPAAPSGWTTVFSDNFAGSAGSAPSSANWFYDIGTGFGTGEIENTTSSTSNCSLDGSGDLKLTAIDSGGTWTSCRLESSRDDFYAPPGGQMIMEADIEQPAPPNGLGYWPAFWALGSPMRAGGGWPTSGEIDMMEDVNASNEASQTLHDSANSPGHALTACPSGPCDSTFNTYEVLVNRVNTSAEYLEFIMDGTVESTITEASVGTTAWQDAIDHGFFIIWDLAMGGNYPNGTCDCTTPTSSTSSGYSMLAKWVAVYETGNIGQACGTGCTYPATPTATGKVTGLNGLCLDNQGGLNTEHNPIMVSTCNGTAAQTWSVENNGTLQAQGGCLDVNSAGTTSGTKVSWYPCNGTAAQSWAYQSDHELVNTNSGLCLTVPGGDTADQLDIETCSAASDQLWTLPTGGTSTTTSTTTTTSTSTTTTTTTTGGTCGGTNVAQGKPTTASSVQSSSYPASNATDGNTSTRWSSAFSDPQWLQVDLGSAQPVCKVVIDWQNSYAVAFQVQVSNDATTWTTVYSTTTGTGGDQTINVSGSGRYIRMYGTVRHTQYGYSIYELQVYTT